MRVKVCFIVFIFSIKLESVGNLENWQNLFFVDLLCGVSKTIVLNKVIAFVLAAFNEYSICGISTILVVLVTTKIVNKNYRLFA